MATKGFWQKIATTLSRSRDNLNYQLKSIFTGQKLTAADWELLEEVLIQADIGVDTTINLVNTLKEKAVSEGVFAAEKLTELLKEQLVHELKDVDGGFDFFALKPSSVLLFVGVNGTGKTTSLAKAAYFYKQKSARIALVAADTFRAAAIEQLEKWGQKIGVDVIKHQRGADPAAVVYDAIGSLKAKKYDYLFVDTAGRLHTYVNLMEELKKVKRVAVREAGEENVKTVLVIDATTGQNGIAQAKIFDEALNLDGLILTKLDGTAKGGIALAIQKQLGIPILLLGTGEKIDDLAPFSAEEYAASLTGLELHF